LTENACVYKSIFSNETFAWLKSLHEKFGAVISLFVFFEDGNFNLAHCTDSFKKEFEENSSWLRFGFHSLNAKKSYEKLNAAKDYAKTVDCLERIAGSRSITRFIRLQKFAGSRRTVISLSQMKNYPVEGFFTADDSRKSYCLNGAENRFVYAHEKIEKYGLKFISTDIRAEYVDDADRKIAEFSAPSWNNQRNWLVVFSHEFSLNEKTKNSVEKFCAYAKENGYSFAFPEDFLQNK
jgi:hypothetical protein